MTRDDEIVRLREQLAVSESLREAQVKELSGKLIECVEAMCEDGNEIARLERILTALREPSEAMLVAIGKADAMHGDVSDERMVAMLRAAVAAAEKEVNGD